jgi:hypothetical protein
MNQKYNIIFIYQYYLFYYSYIIEKFVICKLSFIPYIIVVLQKMKNKSHLNNNNKLIN